MNNTKITIPILIGIFLGISACICCMISFCLGTYFLGTTLDHDNFTIPDQDDYMPENLKPTEAISYSWPDELKGVIPEVKGATISKVAYINPGLSDKWEITLTGVDRQVYDDYVRTLRSEGWYVDDNNYGSTLGFIASHEDYPEINLSLDATFGSAVLSVTIY